MDIKKRIPFLNEEDDEEDASLAGGVERAGKGSEKSASGTSTGDSEVPVGRESGQKEISKEGEPHVTPPGLRGPGYVIGRSLRDGRPVRLPAEGRIHSLIVGKSGTGKTTFMLTQMLQDVERGDSVFVFDPQGDLAERFMTFLPEDRWEDVVYVNPTTHHDYEEGVVKFNFLSAEKIRHADLETDAFMKPLEKLYSDFWGPRLEGIMAHGINLLRKHDQKHNDMDFTLFNLARVLSEDSVRESLLRDAGEHQERFWRHDFSKMPRKAPTAALTKMYKLTQSETLRPMIDTTYTTVDLYECMQEGKIVIFDLRTSDLAEEYPGFLGSLFLARLTMLGMVRQGIPKEERTPVHVYADEAHRFVTETIASNMRALRKYRVYFTIASQNLYEYEGRASNELPELAETIVVFQCGRDTAEGVESAFSMIGEGDRRRVSDAITNLNFYNFYMSTQAGGGKRSREIPARTIDPGTGSTNPPDVIRTSLKIYGEEPKTERKINLSDIEFSLKKRSPVEYYVLQTVRTAGEIRLDRLKEKIEEDYGIEPNYTRKAVEKLGAERLLTLRQRETQGTIEKRKPFYSLTTEGEHELYPRWTPHSQMGGGDHVEMICRLMEKLRMRDCYPVPLDGEKEAEKVIDKGEWEKAEMIPDLLVLLPAKTGGQSVRPRKWKDRVLLVEAEAYPRGEKSGGAKGSGAKGSRTIDHFRTAHEAGLPVVFGVKEGDEDYVEEKLYEAGAKVVKDVIDRPRAGNAELYTLDMEKGNFLFDADESGMSEDLDRNSIPEKLRTRFKEKGHRLSGNPSLFVEGDGERWRISAKRGTYVVERKDDKLDIYRGGVGKNLKEQIEDMREEAERMQEEREWSTKRSLMIDQIPDLAKKAEERGEDRKAEKMWKIRRDFLTPDVEVEIGESIEKLKRMGVAIEGIKELTDEEKKEPEPEAEEKRKTTVEGEGEPETQKPKERSDLKDKGALAEEEAKDETEDERETHGTPKASGGKRKGGEPQAGKVTRMAEKKTIGTEAPGEEGGTVELIPKQIETLEDLETVKEHLKNLLGDDSRSKEAVDLISRLRKKCTFREDRGYVRLRVKVVTPEGGKRQWKEQSLGALNDRKKKLFRKANVNF